MVGFVGHIGKSGFGVVHKVGSTGLGTVAKVGTTGLGGLVKVGEAGFDGVHRIGEVGIGGAQMMASAGLGAARGVMGAERAENEGAHSLAVDLSTGADDDAGGDAGGVIGLEDEPPAAQEDKQGEALKGQRAAEAVVGWLQSIGGVSSGRTIAELVEQNRRQETTNILTVLIPPSFYGTVYHNAAIIVFAVLTTRLLTMLRMGWGWLVILLTICTSVYTISIERTRARARDDIARELTKVRLVDETETADWINNLLDRAWLIAEPLLGGESQRFTLENASLTTPRSNRRRHGGRHPRQQSPPTGPRFRPDDHVHPRQQGPQDRFRPNVPRNTRRRSDHGVGAQLYAERRRGSDTEAGAE